MNSTYRMVGADGSVYGPVSLDDLRRWIQEGRVGPQTQIHRHDQTAWQPASAFPELGLDAQPSQPDTPSPEPPDLHPAALAPQSPASQSSVAPSAEPAASRLTLQIKSSAGWFYWIAGLSLVNTLASLFQGSWGFVLGLGVTQVLDAIAAQAGNGGRALALALNAVALGLFVGFGVMASRRNTWAFVLGLVLYLLDGLVFLVVRDWLPFGFHLLASYFIFKGLQACRLFHKLPTST